MIIFRDMGSSKRGGRQSILARTGVHIQISPHDEFQRLASDLDTQWEYRPINV